MKHIFIVNPNAGKSDQTKLIQKTVNQLFMDKEIEGTYRIERTSSREETKAIARKYAQSGEKAILYACGGDGTLNDVLNGCMGYDNIVLSHLPIGTGNDFIKYFGSQAREDFMNLKELMQGNIVDVDVMKVNDIYCINIANIGLDAMVAFNVDKFKRLPFIRGKDAYQLSIAYSFFTSISHSMKIVVDGIEEKENCFTIVACANAKYYGGNYCAAPLADIQDGKIEVILIPKVSRVTILKLIGLYQKGEHLDGKHDDVVHYRQAKKVQFISEEPLAVCIEGEKYLLQNPTIEIVDKKLKMLVPQKYTQLEKLIQL
ncbi:MAG: diacylglycerol/lipid kinase family protein [Traorella sp.]